MRLLRSTAIIGSLTLVSRLLGLVRDILIARFWGQALSPMRFSQPLNYPMSFAVCLRKGRLMPPLFRFMPSA